MSLYQCEHCGCCENTALGAYYSADMPENFDWSGMEERKGKRLCSACGPTKYVDGDLSGYGQWHGEFERTYLPMGAFHTNKRGNLQHNETGSEDFRAFALTRAAAALGEIHE